VPFCQDLSAEDNFTCCISIDKHINCYQSCSHDIVYLPTSNLNCSGNGETQDDTNIETSPVYNSTCPPEFKEMSVSTSFPVCLQCNDTSTANDTGTTSYATTGIMTRETTKSYTTTGYETKETTDTHSKLISNAHTKSVSVNPTSTTTNGHSSTTLTKNNNSKRYKMAMAAVILSVISVIGVVIIIILFLVRRKRTRSTPVSTLEYFINVIFVVYSSQILSILVKYRLPFSFFFILNHYPESGGHF